MIHEWTTPVRRMVTRAYVAAYLRHERWIMGFMALGVSEGRAHDYYDMAVSAAQAQRESLDDVLYEVQRLIAAGVSSEQVAAWLDTIYPHV